MTALSGAMAELRRGWPVLAGAILGVGVGVVALPSAAVSLFMHDLQTSVGWSRAEISLASTILFGVLAASAPVVGWLADRMSEAKIAAASILILGGVFLAVSQAPARLGFYYAAFAAMGFLGAGAATVTFARAISRTFVQARGLALGLSMIGTGVSSAVLPMVLAPYVAEQGWRAGFMALAAVAVVSAPVVWLLLRRTPPELAPIAPLDGKAAAPGRIVLDATFWKLALVFGLVPLAAVGMQLHYLAFLTDAGLTPAQAGALAGLIGVSVLVGRILTGWLMDRIFAPYVAAAMMGVSALGLLALGLWGAPAALAGVVALGLSIGAEIDLIGYLTARYYGLKVYGRVYGLFYLVCLVGSALSPLAYGLIRDAGDGYQAAQFAAAAVLVLTAAIFLTLRRYRDTMDA